MTAPAANSIVVIGGGGHAKVVIELLRSLGNYHIVGCLDGDKLGQSVLGVPVIGNDDALANLSNAGIKTAALALGGNALREKLAREASAIGFSLPALLSPSALVSETASIGSGTVVLPRAVLHTSSAIGAYCIINTGAIIEHDCVLGQSVHIAPGSVLCGGVRIGDRTLIGANTTIIPQVEVGPDTVIGAGSVVVRTIAGPGTYAGSPAKLLH